MNGKRFLVIGLSVALGGFGVAAFAGGDKDKAKDKQPGAEQAEGEETEAEAQEEEDTTFATGTPRKGVDAIVASWGERPRALAKTMIEKYGQPDEMTPSMLIWHDNGPWKKTIVHRDEVPHNFPQPHTDILEQFIPYQVPVDRFDELAAYDGSVVARRTEGVISARCDNEAMNFLALNLADDLVKGDKEVEEARTEYAQVATRYLAAKKEMKATKGTKATPAKKAALPAETKGLTFDVAAGDAGDPDRKLEAKTRPASEREGTTPRRE